MPGCDGRSGGYLRPYPRPVPLSAAPMQTKPGPITVLLARWSEGDEAAFNDLVALAYDDLRAIAHRRLLAAGGGTLATTALVHEVYLRLAGNSDHAWEGRAQFFSFASKAMRHILVDHARQERTEKRGAGTVWIPLEEATLAAGTPDGAGDVLGVDEALQRLAALHPRMGQVVELRFFGGLTVDETAEVLKTSVRTVEREWTRARAYLLEALDRAQPGEGGGDGL